MVELAVAKCHSVDSCENRSLFELSMKAQVPGTRGPGNRGAVRGGDRAGHWGSG